LETTEPVVISAVVMVVMTSSCPLGLGRTPLTTLTAETARWSLPAVQVDTATSSQQQ
jgi:hypothetical protein